MLCCSCVFVGRVSGGRAKRMLPRRSKGGWGDAVAFCQREPTTAPTPASMTRWCPIYNGGAQDIISTGSNHRRRNCSPAWLLAPRSAQQIQSEAEDRTEDRRGDSGDKVG
jgi:hypothetical protein